jgi:carbamoyltransferase
LAERLDDYALKPRIRHSPFMMFAYHSRPLAHDHLYSASHPRDRTVRAQTVTASLNPGYYKVLKSFEETTGIGGILNTSFNLHGFPIVQSPRDAFDVFLRSGLTSIAVENYYVEKRSCRNNAFT